MAAFYAAHGLEVEPHPLLCKQFATVRAWKLTYDSHLPGSVEREHISVVPGPWLPAPLGTGTIQSTLPYSFTHATRIRALDDYSNSIIP
jgi:hypothetical protein